MFMARVVAVHAESHAVDLVSMQDGRRFSGVQVLSPMAGGNVGHVDLPEPSVTDPNKRFESGNTGLRDMYAMVEFVHGAIPVVLGFLFPQVTQCNFAAKNFRVDRHASDVYSTLDGAGNLEYYHPSGTYIRIAETLDHVDLTETDADKTWKIANNTTKAPGLKLVIKNGGSVRATLTIDASGNVSLSNVGTLSLSSVGNATLHSDGNVTISAGGNVAITGTRIDLN